jgi:hypothetical protein
MSYLILGIISTFILLILVITLIKIRNQKKRDYCGFYEEFINESHENCLENPSCDDCPYNLRKI